MLDETEIRSRTSSGENLRRQSRHPKLHHSRSDDNRRRSFDKHPKDSLSSRHSLNTQAVVESTGSDFEQKYFTTVSLDTEESRADNSDESHVIEIEDANPGALSPEGPTESDMLLEEPELENVTEIEVENSGDDFDDDDKKCESRISIDEMTDVASQEYLSTIVSEDSQMIASEATVHDTEQTDNGKYETSLCTKDDEV